jgi:hypothetical protein
MRRLGPAGLDLFNESNVIFDSWTWGTLHIFGKYLTGAVLVFRIQELRS